MTAERVVPNAELSDVGMVASVVTDHDGDPDTDTACTAATSNNIATEYGVDFGLPTANLTIGANLQEFRAGVRQFDTGQSGVPTARIELWENGSLIRAGGENNVTGAQQVISFLWNANEIATIDGSLVQMKVIGTKAGGNPATRNAVDIGQMEWNADYTAGTSVTVVLAGQGITSSEGSVTVRVDATAILAGQEVASAEGGLTVRGDALAILSGQGITSSEGAITVDAGGGWSVTDVDGDESIVDAQTGVVISITGTVAVAGKTVWIEQGGNWVEQSVTAQDASSATITVTYGGSLVAGAATLHVRNPL